MKLITTSHPEIGYSNNVAIVEEALRTHFGFNDDSHVLTAVAAHIWSGICGTGEQKRWGSSEVKHALACVRARLSDLEAKLGLVSPENAPLRLNGLIRRHSVGATNCGTDIVLVEQNDQRGDSAVAVLTGVNAHANATRILTAVNGRAPRFEPVPESQAPAATPEPAAQISPRSTSGDSESVDDLYEDAVKIVRETRRASTSTLQRRLRIGYNRAWRLLELMEQRGVVGPENGASPRAILNQ